MIELGSSMPQLADYRFAEMQPVQLEARDGLQLHGYLTLPPGYEQPGPLVLLVHGGPTGRDQWGYSPVVQWLASRGYACLQVNFRGSTGYGKRFQAAGDRQWGAAMQDDLSDAVAWAAGQGIADPARVGIMGVSYGGYAVLAGLTLTPELYAAGVALNPVCDLEEHLRYWDALRPARRTETERRVGCLPRWTDGERAGEFKDEADWTPAERDEVEALRQRSPLHCAGRLRVPLLIGHGVADTRVREAGSARFVEACRAQGADVEYVVYQDEGHWLARPETYSDFYGRAEQLLSRTIGDR